MRWINLSSPGVETFEGSVISTLGILLFHSCYFGGKDIKGLAHEV
jgi:hypothetical protein